MRGLEGRTDRSVKGDMEGWGHDNFITTFILHSKCANIVLRPGCPLTRKGILSIPLDSQSHSGRPEKEQSAIPLAAVMGILRLGMGLDGGRTGIGKENRKEEEINCILNNYYCQRFSCQHAPKTI